MTWRQLGIRYVFMMLAVFAVSSFGAPPLTTIEDTLYKADGTPFEGVLMISWRSFEGPQHTNVPTNSLSAQVVGGNLFVKLIPTTTAPTAAYYSVRYVSQGSVESTELWSVPPSSTPLQVSDVRIEWPPTTPSAGQATEVQIEDVVGLRDELDIRAVKGLTYAPSRAAVVGTTGELEAAVGELTDCVRVDGSTGPCGSASEAGFVDGEIPAGTVDGLNTSFTLADMPNPESSLQIYRNGILQRRSYDYFLASSTVTFVVLSTPQSGDLLLASYRVIASLTDEYGFVDDETPGGEVDGVNSSFTLTVSPNPANSLQLFRNGLLQRDGADYSITGNVITFLPVSVPQAGDVLVATYRSAGS